MKRDFVMMVTPSGDTRPRKLHRPAVWNDARPSCERRITKGRTFYTTKREETFTLWSDTCHHCFPSVGSLRSFFVRGH